MLLERRLIEPFQFVRNLKVHHIVPCLRDVAVFSKEIRQCVCPTRIIDGVDHVLVCERSRGVEEFESLIGPIQFAAVEWQLGSSCRGAKEWRVPWKWVSVASIFSLDILYLICVRHNGLEKVHSVLN